MRSAVVERAAAALQAQAVSWRGMQRMGVAGVAAIAGPSSGGGQYGAMLTDVHACVEHGGDGVRLAGSVWQPSRPARGLVLMHPGSGPSDRDNDVLFPPIRAVMLDVGVAVCSFDKRGVGDSTGSWLDAGIEVQAADLEASLMVAREVVPEGPVGLFGHSQGGWVVLEASRHVDVDFVVTNSGPAVSPRTQERYSTEQRLRSRGWPAERVDMGVALFDGLADQVATSDPNAGLAWLNDPARADLVAGLAAAGCFVPDSVELWALAAVIIDYDPTPALRDLRVPVLALFGSDDTVVPVSTSVGALAEHVAPDLLHLHVIPDGDHRLQVDNDTFAPSYLATLTGFVTAQLV